jgi:selenocysteine lyase/cysteine desulfurase
MAGPIAWARDYFGVQVKIVDMPTNFTSDYTVDYVLSLFEPELRNTPAAGNKQYLAISEVFYKNGLRMPVKELCQLAKAYGAYTIIDSAHGWGQLPVNCHDYGVDFIAGAGHKWLCGGPGTGILYIRNQGGSLPPFNGGNWGSYGNLFTAPSAKFYNREKATGGWQPGNIQGRGETNTPALYAMSDSAAFFNYVGVSDIYARGVALGNYFKDKVATQWGQGALFVQKNSDPRFATALTAFNPFAGKDDSGQYAVSGPQDLHQKHHLQRQRGRHHLSGER